MKINAFTLRICDWDNFFCVQSLVWSPKPRRTKELLLLCARTAKAYILFVVLVFFLRSALFAGYLALLLHGHHFWRQGSLLVSLPRFFLQPHKLNFLCTSLCHSHWGAERTIAVFWMNSLRSITACAFESVAIAVEKQSLVCQLDFRWSIDGAPGPGFGARLRGVLQDVPDDQERTRHLSWKSWLRRLARGNDASSLEEDIFASLL